MEDESNIIQCKIVLVGESGVGKTCIISRYVSNYFDENEISTMGASYACKEMTFDEYGGKSVKFEIWDTAGQEKYRSVTRLFYKDSSIAILVYDITRKESFEQMKNYWYEQILEYAPKDLIFAIAANKSDLSDKEDVSDEEGREFAKQIDAIFRPTSAYVGSGIDDLFYCVGCKFLDPNFQEDESKKKREQIRKSSVMIKKRKTEVSNNSKNCCN